MNKKNLMVSFLTTAIALFLIATVSAYTVTPVTGGLITNESVKIDGVFIDTNTEVGIIAGDTIVVQVFFDSQEDATDVRVKAEIEGDKLDVDARTDSFDVESGKTYMKTLKLKVPFELKDDLSEDFTLNVKVWNGDVKSEIEGIVLRVQRPSYNPVIKSISTPSNIESGGNIPVDLVIKNVGYNDLDDLYVTASISALGIEKTSYFGNLVSLKGERKYTTAILDSDGNPILDSDGNMVLTTIVEGDDNDEDTASGRIFLKIPFNVAPGIYTLEVKVANDDVTLDKVKQIVIENDFETTVFASGNDLWIVNPTNKVVGYKIIPESADVSESVVFVPAGSSKVIKVSPEGEAKVNIFTISGELVSTVNFEGKAESDSVSNSVVILTVILAIVFLVLLIVLIVLITKKPEKTDEFGESYY